MSVFRKYGKMMKLIQGFTFAREGIISDNLLPRVKCEHMPAPYKLSRTLDAHIRSLRKKLEGYGKMIETVRNVGYRWEPDNDK